MNYGFLIDMDGVIYREKELIPGAKPFIEKLQQEGVPFRFVTNNSQRSRLDIQLRLKRMGILVDISNIFTCAMATARFLARQKPNGSAYVIGEGGLLTALHRNGYALDDIDPDFVVVGEGKSFTMNMIETATQLVFNGAKLIATNIDPNCPTESGIRPGCGAIVSMLETATGMKAFSVGKPSPVILREAQLELQTPPERTVVVGDTMSTDILGGVQMSFHSILVLSGGTKREDLKHYAFRADEIVDSVADLIDHPFLTEQEAQAV